MFISNFSYSFQFQLFSIVLVCGLLNFLGEGLVFFRGVRIFFVNNLCFVVFRYELWKFDFWVLMESDMKVVSDGRKIKFQVFGIVLEGMKIFFISVCL